MYLTRPSYFSVPNYTCVIHFYGLAEDHCYLETCEVNKMEHLQQVKDIMTEFAANTGLDDSSSSPPRRYLWTDGFAVCVFLELHRQTGDSKFKDLALSLVQQVHHVLCRHRKDDGEKRNGWISGLSEEEGEQHPTQGGVRIGKKLPERLPSDRYDEEEEWDRDGQYFHYLTKWMQALSQVSAAAGDVKYAVWGTELASAVHSKFTYSTRSSKRMYWKMSIDLSRPLVPSMGHHDPLDGFVTYYQLKTSVAKDTCPSLEVAMSDLYSIVEGQDLSTNDPLGLGGLLCDAYRVFQLYVKTKDKELLKIFDKLLRSSLEGLKTYNQRRLELPVNYRLAFREFGLSIGLQAIRRLKDSLTEFHEEMKDLIIIVNKIVEYQKLIENIHKFWGEEINRKTSSWRGHLDINMVMWATSLLPDGYLRV